jgi:hypothetical protein
MLCTAIAAVSALLAPALVASASAQSSVPGTPLARPPADLATSAPREGDPLLPFATESGLISLSLDGAGTNNPAGAPIMVHKNVAGATVRKAYLFAASTGFSGYTPVNGDVTIDGTPVEWNPANTISNDISSVNVEADVTNIVKEKIDAAPAGNVEFNVAEPNNTYEMDGEILAVILNDPSVKQTNSVTLMYGAQNPAGDSFHVGLAEPVNKSNPAFALNLSLGISFGYQTAFETSQFSIVHANGKLLSQMAGGQDDCVEKYSATPNFAVCENGELLTVGGIGDTTEDPNPNETVQECAEKQGEPVTRCDDELYTLLPFVNNGEKELSFETLNPSDNDNIFFAALETHANAAVVGEGITLAPISATNKVGELHVLTATLQDEHGEKLGGRTAHFEVVSGPNAGLKGESIANGNGEATFSYTSKTAGTDHIVATFTNAEDEVVSSNEVTETWEEEALAETGPVLDGIASAQHYNEATAKLTTKAGGDLIVAFVAADSPFTEGQISSVSGGGLTWSLVGRENAALGGAEVWEARASGALNEAPITATATRLTPGSPVGQGYDETITVAAFKNAPGLGAVGKFSSKKGAATGTVTTTAPNSWVWGIGDDWLASANRKVPAGQTLWHEATDRVGDTYWVQSAAGLTKSAGTPVTINDPAPTTDPFDLVLVEVL